MQLLPGKNDQLVMLKLGNEWLVRALVISSLVAHLLVLVLAGTRRRRASGVCRAFLWPSYLVAGWAATHSISNLMLGVVTSRDQRLHAFWTPFLLMHLALPDNISAYSLEDNTLSSRQMARAPAQVTGAILILYKNFIFVHGAGTLRLASYLMFTLGIAKYMESAWALWQGNLDTIRGSIKKMNPKVLSPAERENHNLDKEQALLFAHGLLHITKGAFADYSLSLKTVSPKGDSAEGSKPVSPKRDLAEVRPFSKSKGWKDMCTVVEMELSLMYDVMYTKAALAHTWRGYCIRVLSPPFTAAALLLFWFDSKDGESGADVMITYALLLVTLVLDVGWLLGTLGSTWTCAFLKHKSHWLLECSMGRCHGLIRSLGFVAGNDPTSYRLWSGTIGQYNLLRENCRKRRAKMPVKMFSGKDFWMEYQYGNWESIALLPCVKDLLFQKVWEVLEQAFPPAPPETKDAAVILKDAGKKREPGSRRRRPEATQGSKVVADINGGQNRQGELGKILKIGPEFQELVLMWHVATEIFLLLCRPSSTAPGSSIPCKHVKAIRALSNYMMFLVAVRPSMLPGLYLRSTFDATRKALDRVAADSPINERELAEILQANEAEATHSGNRPDDSSTILSEGTFYAEAMLFRMGAYSSWVRGPSNCSPEEKDRWTGPLHSLAPGLYHNIKTALQMEEMLEIILSAWVRLLITASTRCGPGSHAKQLSRGGDLTTVVWMLVEHAGIFRIPTDETETTSPRPCWSLQNLNEPYHNLRCTQCATLGSFI